MTNDRDAGQRVFTLVPNAVAVEVFPQEARDDFMHIVTEVDFIVVIAYTHDGEVFHFVIG